MNSTLSITSEEFKGKVALVTGGASGIGQATAFAFAKRGATVVVWDIGEDASETIEAIQDVGGEALYIKVDVANEASVQQGVKQIIEKYGRLDFAHNNAGIRNVSPITELSLKDWNQIIAVNLTGVFLGLKHQIPVILKTDGAIVNTASIWGMTGAENRSAYVASKAGVIGITQTAAAEYAAQNIRINAVAPGLIMTEAAATTLNQGIGANAVINRTPRNKPGTPEDIAEAVVWLCSEHSKNINGIVLPVDGGWSAC